MLSAEHQFLYFFVISDWRLMSTFLFIFMLGCKRLKVLCYFVF